MSSKHIITLCTAQLAPEVEDSEAGYAIALRYLLQHIYNGDVTFAGIEKAYHDDFIENQADFDNPIVQDETLYEIRLDLDTIINEGQAFKPDTSQPDALVHYVTLVLENRDAVITFYDGEDSGFTRRRIFIDLQASIDTSSMDDYDELIDRLP